MQYQIVGDTLPAVVCTLEQKESMITQNGGMAWMTPNMKMEEKKRRRRKKDKN